MSERVEALLEAILAELKSQRSGKAVAAPVYPSAPIFIDPIDNTRNGGYPGSPLPMPVYNESRCGRCGISLAGVMGYVCSDQKCPSGLGSATGVAQ